VISLILAALVAQIGCTPGTENEPPLCPTRLPAIRSITIEETGVRLYPDPDGPASCAGFRPTRAQVRRYLMRALTTDAMSAHATLDRSPCQANGRVRLADGRVARWTIELYRVGRLDFPGQPSMLLYCPQCRERPFVW